MSKTDREPTDPHASYAELAAAYVLHALEPEDEAVILGHLPHCAECSADVEQWRNTAAHLAHASEQAEPSPELRERLLAAIGHTDSELPAPAAAPAVIRSISSGTPRRLARRGTIQVSVRALAMAAAFTGLVAGGVVVFDRTQTGHSSVSNNAADLVRIFATPGSRTIDLGSNGKVAAKAVVAGSQVWLVASGLPANDTDSSTYVLWTSGSGLKMLPIATFDASRTGTTIVKVSGLPAGAAGKVFAVSYELGRKAPQSPSSPVLGPNAAV